MLNANGTLNANARNTGVFHCCTPSSPTPSAACQEAYIKLVEQEACSTGCASQPSEPEIKRRKVRNCHPPPIHFRILMLLTARPANPAAPSHDSPPQAPIRDGGRFQLVQRHRELRPELHLLHLDLLPAGR